MYRKENMFMQKVFVKLKSVAPRLFPEKSVLWINYIGTPQYTFMIHHVYDPESITFLFSKYVLELVGDLVIKITDCLKVNLVYCYFKLKILLYNIIGRTYI